MDFADIKSCFTTKGSETSSMESEDWREVSPLTKVSETSNVKPVGWRTEKPSTKGVTTSSVKPED